MISGQEGRQQKHTTLGNFAPNVPGNVEADRGNSDIHVRLDLSSLFCFVEAKPLGHLERKLSDTDRCDNLGDTFDDVGSLLIKVVGKNRQWNGDNHHDEDSKGSGQEGRPVNRFQKLLLRGTIFGKFRALDGRMEF